MLEAEICRFVLLRKVTKCEPVDLDWVRNSPLKIYMRRNYLQGVELQFLDWQTVDDRKFAQAKRLMQLK